mmetsp:Transcript_24328/g.50954  ORF Transcript_24328/g.50954 Transcript_24328/m.50954 type:complete len:259 (+) Transcript_24328:42-818(+)
MTNPESASSSSTSLGANALSYLTSLLNIIQTQNWDAFDEIAIQNPRAFQALSDIISSTNEFNGMSFLHAIVREHPPLKTVADVIRLSPDSPRACDCLNRTPLHVAAGIGASPQVISYLCMVHPKACIIQDEDGKTPLHLACDIECKLFEGQPARQDPPTLEVIRALLSASFAAASVEDEDEMSPLEYAILSNANIRVIKLLQKAAQKFMKNSHENQKQNEYEHRSRMQLGAAVNAHESSASQHGNPRNGLALNKFAYM